MLRPRGKLTIRISSDLIDDGLLRLPGNALKVYLIIAMHANYTTGVSWPTFNTIRAYTGIVDNRTIANAIKILKARGFIEYEKRKFRRSDGSECGRVRYIYRLLHPASAEKYVRNEVQQKYIDSLS